MTSKYRMLWLMLPFLLPGSGCSGEEPTGGAAVPRGPANTAAVYRGICDASAAVAIDSVTFIVADDERNSFQVYRTDRPGAPVQSIPWDEHLGIDPREEHPEADVEGAAVLDGRVYWITSHGRSKSGKWRPNRHRLFAMTITQTAEGIVARPYGKAYRDLAEDLAADRRLRELGVARALKLGDDKDKDLAPKDKGLNIEGLCASADGKSLLIALRNPRPDGKALLVPLKNPAAVLTQAAAAEFGQPVRWRLSAGSGDRSNGLGIRSIEYSRRHGAYLIVAGPHDTKKRFALYRWSAEESEPPALLPSATRQLSDIDDFSPEALIVYPANDAVQLLSDDGALRVKVASRVECEPDAYDNGWCEAKYLKDANRKTFKSVWVEVK